MNYSPLRHLGAVIVKRPIHLTFFVTGKCNAKCPFCFYLSGDGHKNINGKSELSLDEIKKISSSLGDLLWLAFSGGEIFLREDLPEIVKTFYGRNRPSIILLPTNGLLPERISKMTREILDYCRKSVVVVKLSLDSTDDSAHDRLRGIKGSFGKVMSTYEMLGPLLDEYSNFELGVNSVFCSQNQDGMGSLMEFVNNLSKIKTHTVSLVRGNVPEELKQVDLGKYHETANRLARDLRRRRSSIYRFRGARLKAAQDVIQRELIMRTAFEKRQMLPCYAGKLNLVLTETGDVYPCELLAEKMGNIRESGYDLQGLLHTDKAETVLRKIRESGCHCTHECYMMTNILFNPRKYPALLLEYLRLLF